MTATDDLTGTTWKAPNWKSYTITGRQLDTPDMWVGTSNGRPFCVPGSTIRSWEAEPAEGCTCGAVSATNPDCRFHYPEEAEPEPVQSANVPIPRELIERLRDVEKYGTFTQYIIRDILDAADGKRP